MNRKRILIADDDAAIALLLEVFIKYLELDCQVIIVSDGLAALHELQQRSFDLILTDYAMPGLNGPDLVERYRFDQPGGAGTNQRYGGRFGDSQFGYGRMDAAAAMNVLQTSPATSTEPASAQAVATPLAAPFISGEVLLKLRPGLNVNDVLNSADLKSHEVRAAGEIGPLGIHKLAVNAGQEQALLTKLLKLTGVVYAELNYRVKVQ